jgi:23S rRNA pseudouridine1911/1915/1917 synthase
MMLNILYEDNHIIVVVKPSGILSQEDITKDPDMVTLLKKYIKDKYNKPGDVYLGLVQRLDRMTSGVMVFARTSKAASRLSEQIRNHSIIKKYYAVVEGKTKDEDKLENYLIKDEDLVKSFVTTKEKGKFASLEYKKVKSIDNSSLVEVTLHTGRHHQIRVQMSNINHPLLGDSLYGSTTKSNMYLHCYYLKFIHPTTKEELVYENIPTGNLWDEYFK